MIEFGERTEIFDGSPAAFDIHPYQVADLDDVDLILGDLHNVLHRGVTDTNSAKTISRYGAGRLVRSTMERSG